jgi:aspartate carbamoyltransferase catalytic subunit
VVKLGLDMPKLFETLDDFYQSSFVSIEQLNLNSATELINLIKQTKDNPNSLSNRAKNKILYSLFFNDSTRTRFSTETAWLKLGGQIVSQVGTNGSSLNKGETMYHTLATYASYLPDIIAIRCNEANLPLKATTWFPSISWVNCGDASNEHPTQAILDLFTISEVISDISKLKIAFVGDIKHGRTVRSLSKLLNLFGAQMYFVAPVSLQNQKEYELDKISYQYVDIENLIDIVQEVDIIYATRPQIERMNDSDKQKYQNGVYQITNQIMNSTRAKLLHPLPIDSSVFPEIHPEVDSHPQALYFQQMENGLYARMAILSLIVSGNQVFTNNNQTNKNFKSY